MGGTPAQRKGFPPGARIRAGRDFRKTRDHGERLVIGCLIVNWRIVPNSARPRLGVITSRKVGGAVQRSRARRLVREVFRLHQAELLANIDVVVVARPSISERDFAQVERDFVTTIRKAGLMK